MTRYKLYYFDVRGRGELIRLLFRAAGVDFEDHRVKVWKNYKHQMPTGQLPVLEVEGKKIAQSLTIARYVSREFDPLDMQTNPFTLHAGAGLYRRCAESLLPWKVGGNVRNHEYGLAGNSNLQQALVEQVVDTCDDLRAENAKIIHEQDKEKLIKLKENMTTEIFPRYMKILTNLLKENGNRYFVGSQLTLADLCVHETLTNFVQKDPGILQRYKAIEEHRKLIESHPRLSDYFINRPITEV